MSLATCTSIKYINDIGYLNSAQAGSDEFPIKISYSQVCKDLDGIPGLCSKRWDNNSDFTISIDAQPYQYNYQLSCTSQLNSNDNRNVVANQNYDIVISKDKYLNLPSKSFTCIVEIFPQDRPEAVSSRAEIRVKLIDGKYVSRETMYIQEQGTHHFLITGQYALHTHVCRQGTCKIYNKETWINVGDGKDVKAYSESYVGRFNFLGI